MWNIWLFVDVDVSIALIFRVIKIISYIFIISENIIFTSSAGLQFGEL